MWWTPEPVETRRPAQVAAEMLKSAALSNEDRQLLTSAVLDRLGVLPTRARITVDESGVIFLDGKQMTLDAARMLRDGSRAMLNNFARRIVRETVEFLAVKQGVHENTSPEQGLFAKAALWFYQEESDLYLRLAQVEGEEDA